MYINLYWIILTFLLFYLFLRPTQVRSATRILCLSLTLFSSIPACPNTLPNNLSIYLFFGLSLPRRFPFTLISRVFLTVSSLFPLSYLLTPFELTCPNQCSLHLNSRRIIISYYHTTKNPPYRSHFCKFDFFFFNVQDSDPCINSGHAIFS